MGTSINLKNIENRQGVYYGDVPYKESIMLDSAQISDIYLLTNSEAMDSIEFSRVNLYGEAGVFIPDFINYLSYSINSELRLYSAKKITWYGRLGLGAAGTIGFGGPGGLAAINMLTGKSHNHFEMNGGVFIASSDNHDTGIRQVTIFPLIDLGYRYQKPEGGLIFKAKAGFLGVGLGIGYAF